MRTLVLAVAAATVLAACTAGPRNPRGTEQAGHASSDGAAFMGYHGPVWRSNTPAD
jgi:hypothetical protein